MPFSFFVKRLCNRTCKNDVVREPLSSEVQRVKSISTFDMTQFCDIQYNLNHVVKHFISEGGHPFAYIDMDDLNQHIAKNDLRKIDVKIKQAVLKTNIVPRYVHIPIDDIVFSPISHDYGYTRIICTPYTPSGKISKFPIHLSFMTDLSKVGNETHGDLFYGKNGQVLKASVYIWIKGEGYFFKFKSNENGLFICDISTAK